MLVLQPDFFHMTIDFYKYHGAGNDFIMIDNREMLFSPEIETLTKICHRNLGIGADGLILLENHPHEDFSMRYFNADGREASMCGNGGRCIVAFARFLGLVGNQTNFIAVDGLHQAEVISSSEITDYIKLKMNDVAGVQQFDEDFFLDTGSPHLVRFTQGIDKLDVMREGRNTRNLTKWGADGVNVNFVEVKNGQLFSRTYERGVENETLSCGTGAVAMAIAAYSYGIVKTQPVVIHAIGGKLTIHFEMEDQKISNVWLEGPAERVFKGTIHF